MQYSEKFQDNSGFQSNYGFQGKHNLLKNTEW